VLTDPFWQRLIASSLFAVSVSALVAYLLIKLLQPEPRRDEIKPNGGGRIKESPGLDPDLPPPIKVMVLGLEGSGKTMMMAGMYYRWAFGGHHGVVLRAQETTEEFLSRLVAKINDPDGGMPGSTREGDIVRADFTFMVNTINDGVRRSFSLRYIDYAGEQIRRVLLPGERPPDPEVRKDLDEADILLGVLDGGQIARAMRGDPPKDFAKILIGLMACLANARQKTVHVVISKWDLLVDENGGHYPLSKVIRFLNRYPPFLYFHENPSAIGVRRIIPISTFGLNGFIRVDDDGAVHKNRTLTWQPFMAENAVACSVPDVTETEFKRAIEAYDALGHAGAHRPGKALAPLLKVMLVMLNSFTGIRIADTNGVTYDELTEAWWTFQYWTGKRSDRTEYPDRGTESSRSEVMLRVLQLFEESVRELEDQFPESKIDRPRGGSGANGSVGWFER
jgi:hypothetical protein